MVNGVPDQVDGLESHRVDLGDVGGNGRRGPFTTVKLHGVEWYIWWFVSKFPNLVYRF